MTVQTSKTKMMKLRDYHETMMLMLLNKKELEMAPNSINHTAASYHDEQTSAGISDRDIGASLLE